MIASILPVFMLTFKEVLFNKTGVRLAFRQSRLRLLREPDRRYKYRENRYTMEATEGIDTGLGILYR